MSAHQQFPLRSPRSAVRASRWLIAGAYFSIFSLLLLLPDPLWILRRLGTGGAPWWDADFITTLSYGVHFAGFGLLTLLLIWASRSHGVRRYVWPAAAAALYGALVEVIQIPIPHRTFDLLDIAADCAGCATVAAACALLVRRDRTAVPQALR
jgi:hypothetical protein